MGACPAYAVQGSLYSSCERRLFASAQDLAAAWIMHESGTPRHQTNVRGELDRYSGH